MTLQDLLKETMFNDIAKAMVELYPDQADDMEDYKKVYFKLLNMKPAELEGPMEIYVSRVKDILADEDSEDEEDYYWDVSGVNPDDRKGPHYGIEFNPWNEWCAYTINEDNIKNIPKAELIAHILWELIFCGFDQEDSQDDLKEILRRAGEICEELGKNMDGETFDRMMQELGFERVELDDFNPEELKLHAYPINNKEDDKDED